MPNITKPAAVIQMTEKDKLCLALMTTPNRSDAIGAALATLLHYAEVDKDQLQQCLRTRVSHSAVAGECRIIDVLGAIAR